MFRCCLLFEIFLFCNIFFLEWPKRLRNHQIHFRTKNKKKWIPKNKQIDRTNRKMRINRISLEQFRLQTNGRSEILLLIWSCSYNAQCAPMIIIKLTLFVISGYIINLLSIILLHWYMFPGIFQLVNMEILHNLFVRTRLYFHVKSVRNNPLIRG